jgi:hypothetical protein
MATTTTTTASVKTHLSLTGPVIVPAWVWTCSHDKGSPAKLMISASWPQDLGYSPPPRPVVVVRPSFSSKVRETHDK